MFGIDPNK